jgi:hypothetical protein
MYMGKILGPLELAQPSQENITYPLFDQDRLHSANV